MRVAVVYNEVGLDAGADERDVLEQLDYVSMALDELGHEVDALSCTLNIADLVRRLERIGPDVVFNLVESLGGHDRLIHLVPAVLEALGIPYTGSPAETIFQTTSKVLVKERLWASGLAAPPVLALWPEHRLITAPVGKAPDYDRVVLKPVWDHGSPDMDDSCVVPVDRPDRLREVLRQRAFRGPAFAEPYIEGREFNLSLLTSGQGRGPLVLPPQEILFTDYPPGKPRLVGREAKWQPDSFEYNNTPRRFDFPEEDQLLLRELTQLARVTWKRLGLAGYARIDLRIDSVGRPWIVDVNVNPCLSPDAGFAAALAEAQVRFRAAVDYILSDALARAPNARERRLALVAEGGP